MRWIGIRLSESLACDHKFYPWINFGYSSEVDTSILTRRQNTSPKYSSAKMQNQMLCPHAIQGGVLPKTPGGLVVVTSCFSKWVDESTEWTLSEPVETLWADAVVIMTSSPRLRTWKGKNPGRVWPLHVSARLYIAAAWNSSSWYRDMLSGMDTCTWQSTSVTQWICTETPPGHSRQDGH